MRVCPLLRTSAGLVVVATVLLAAAPPALKEWGKAEDPDGDCRFQQTGNKLTLRVPGKTHNLVAGEGKLNAPRVLGPVQGDFVVTVQVAGEVRPGPKGSVAGGMPYNGAGLLLWENPGHYLRLERAAIVRDGALISYANFEHYQGGRRAASQGARLKDQPTHLRLERRRGKVYASASQDGVTWLGFPPVEAPWPDTLKVGIAAVNTSTGPFTAEMEDYDVFTRRGEPTR